jgi:hypothetical protein
MATKANINIDQGTSFTTYITLTDDAGNALDLSAYRAESQIRRWYNSINCFSFDTSLSLGQIALSMNAETTAKLTQQRYLYDVVLFDGSNTSTRVVEGMITVNFGITKPVNTTYYYGILVGNVQGTICTGDTVYQSNGSANVTGIVYDIEGPLLGYGSNNAANTTNRVTSNTVLIKISDASGSFSTTADSGYIITSSNTNANGNVLSITQYVTR